MTIKRYVANKDNTITNAFKENLTTRATDANMGASDIIEVFSIYAQATTSSAEQARALIEFPVSQIIADRAASAVPASGSVNFILKLTNAEHSSTTPSDFTLSVYPLLNPWTEGTGLDMEGYTDTGVSSWTYRISGSQWGGADGNYDGSLRRDVAFESGLENLEVDISDIVEKWIDGTKDNYGLLIKLSGSAENVIGGADPLAKKSYYTKKFFSRSSEFVLKRPIIEARFDNSIQDDRGDIIKSSSLTPAAENLNNIYLYNKVRGNFRDIPDTVQATNVTGSHLLVQLVPSLGSAPVTASGRTLSVQTANNTVQFSSGSSTYLAAQKNSTGIYNAQFAYGGTETTLYDVWTRRTISGASKVELSQENTGTSGNTTADFSGVSNVAGDAATFESGSDSVRATLTLRVTGIPGNNNVFTLTDAGATSKTFIFKTDTDTFNDASNLDTGRMIIGIQSATTPYAISQRLAVAIPASGLEIESETSGLDLSTDVYTQIYTGSAFAINVDTADSHYPISSYVVNITNLKPSYEKDEDAQFRIYSRSKDWKPNIYTVANNSAPVTSIREGYYKITRPADNMTIIPYSTGSSPSYSKLSYDISGSYFELDMSILEPNYLYEISILRKEEGGYIEQKEKFKFRINP